jgi:hypothetical protein
LPFFGLDLSAIIVVRSGLKTEHRTAPVLKVYLGSDDNTWDVGDPTKVDDLVVDDLNHIERISRADRINLSLDD